MDKSKKYIVIDSLARSGTTLLTAIFRSQNDCCAFTGCCQEARHSISGKWPHGQACHSLMPFQGDFPVNWPSMQALEKTIKTDYLNGISVSDWQQIWNRSCGNFSD